MILILTGQRCKVDSETLARLGSLGVTNVTLLEEASAAGTLIQGWAFDSFSADEAVEMLTLGLSDVRVLRPIMQVSVSPQEIVDLPSGETWTMEKERK